jgi:hypothetical protein
MPPFGGIFVGFPFRSLRRQLRWLSPLPLKFLRLSPLLLIGAVLCFAGTYLSSRYGQAADVLLRTDVARLQSLVVEAEMTAEQEADEVADRLLQGQISFGSLVGRTTYPCFVFRGEELWYWSDHSVQPERENRKRLLRLISGAFLHSAAPPDPMLS